MYYLLGFSLVLTLCLVVWQFSNLASIILGAPPVSTPRKDFWEKIGSKHKTLLDLGCGAGSTLIAASPYFKQIYGIEYSPWYYFVSKLRTRHHANITILWGNFFSLTWPKTDYVYCYLLPSLLKRLRPKLEQQSATVISFGFGVPDWQPSKLFDVRPYKLYYYIPNKV